MAKDMGIFDLLYVLAKRRVFVIGFTAFIAVAAIVYALLVHKYWVSDAVIVPVAESNALGGVDSGLLGMVAGGILGGGASDPAVEFVSIMQSRSFREKVVERFRLIPYFKLQEQPKAVAMETAVFRLANKITRINTDPESKLITLRVETRDKFLSKNIAQYYLDELSRYLRENRGSKSKLQRQFLERQVETTRLEIDSLAAAVRDFQSRNRTIGLDEQTVALIDLYSQNISEYYKADLEYEVGKKQYGPDSPVLEELARRRGLLAGKIRELEDSDTELVPKYLPQIDRIPDLALQFAQLKLNLEIKQKVFEYLYPQYEVAKLEELREMPRFDILDSPSLAGMRSKPRRAVLVTVITIAAFLLACVLAVLIENLRVVHKDKVDRILGTFRRQAGGQERS